jgi:chromosome partitioning protein
LHEHDRRRRQRIVDVDGGRLIAMEPEPPNNVVTLGELAMRARPAHIVVIGNEKGGAGKTTLSMHLTAALLALEMRVACVDLDSRQQSFARYIANRKRWIETSHAALKMPDVAVIERSQRESRTLAEGEERQRFERVISGLVMTHDFIVFDCPGQDNYLVRLAHSLADTLVTPINDSFVDLDLLGQVDPVTFKIERPSVYAEMVWECRKRRMTAARKSIDWVVVRNRLSGLESKNKKRVGDALQELSARIGFRVGPSVAERVTYRELFPMGLTLFDLTQGRVPHTMSHVSAKAEMRALLNFLKLPGVSAPKAGEQTDAAESGATETDAAAE